MGREAARPPQPKAEKVVGGNLSLWFPGIHVPQLQSIRARILEDFFKYITCTAGGSRSDIEVWFIYF